MPNPIDKTSDAFLRRISETSLEAVKRVEQTVTSMFERRFGQQLTLKEGLQHLKAVKVIASVDGYSSEEEKGLRRVMKRLDMPESVVEEVLQFDVESVRLSDLIESVPPGSWKAKAIISGALTVAMLDGLSDKERGAVRHAATLMGLSNDLVDAYEARIRLENLIEARQDPELAEASRQLRVALWPLS